MHDALPAERTGTPASPQLLERRAMFAATEIDPALGVTAGDAEFAGVPCGRPGRRPGTISICTGADTGVGTIPD
ncbi:hypothetical protein NJ76_22260, partial [Rhodococcus sp. IITR03]